MGPENPWSTFHLLVLDGVYRRDGEGRLRFAPRGPAWVAHPAVYRPMADSAGPVRMWVRTRVDPARLAGRLQTTATDIDPSLILDRVQTAEESDRLGLMLIGFYGMDDWGGGGLCGTVPGAINFEQ